MALKSCFWCDEGCQKSNFQNGPMGGFYQLRAAELKHGRVVTGTQKQNAAGVFESPGHTNVIPAVRLVKIDICFYSLWTRFLHMILIICGYTGVIGTLLRWCIAFIQSCIYRDYMEFMALRFMGLDLQRDQDCWIHHLSCLFVSDFACGQETVVWKIACQFFQVVKFQWTWWSMSWNWSISNFRAHSGSQRLLVLVGRNMKYSTIY